MVNTEREDSAPMEHSTQASHQQPSNHQSHTSEATAEESGSISDSRNGRKKITTEEIAIAKNLIERCLQLYMNRDEVVMTLRDIANIDPQVTTLVWQRLEEDNVDFFYAYYRQLSIKQQITNWRAIFLQQHPVTSTGQSQVDSTGNTSSHGLTNEICPVGHFLPMHINMGEQNEEGSVTNGVSALHSNDSDVDLNPSSTASSGQFSSTTTEVSEQDEGTTTALRSTYIASPQELQPESDNEDSNGDTVESLQPLSDVPQDFSSPDSSEDADRKVETGNELPRDDSGPKTSLDFPEQNDMDVVAPAEQTGERRL